MTGGTSAQSLGMAMADEEREKRRTAQRRGRMRTKEKIYSKESIRRAVG
jgi:hypothetical protein